MNKKIPVISLIVLSIVGAMTAMGRPNPYGPDITKKTLDLPEFQNISLNSNYTVYVKQTNKQEVTVEALTEIYDASEFKVENGTLHINIKKSRDTKNKSFWNKIDDIKIAPTLRVIISMRDVEKLMVNGGGKIISENSIASNNLELSVTGSGQMDVDIKGRYIKAGVSGSGKMTVKGYADKVDAAVSGSGTLHGFDLELEKGTATVSGSGACEMNVKSDLAATIYGSGVIKHKGNTKNVVKKEFGSGKVERAY